MSDDVLRRPAPHGARLVALRYLDAADAARERLVAGTDAEALHDFRVALRRLRSWIRAFSAELDEDLRPKDLRRLRDVARATNPGRDLEVQLEWLRHASRGIGRQRKAGAEWLSRHLVATGQISTAAVTRALHDDFPPLRIRIAERLSTVRQPVLGEVVGASLGTAIAARLRAHAQSLGAALDRVTSVEDADLAHEARIRAKRLRYLLEPAAARVADGTRTVKALKGLQDALGALHDAQVMSQTVRSCLEQAAAADIGRRADEAMKIVGVDRPLAKDVPRAGLLALLRRTRGDIGKSFAAVDAAWLGGRHLEFDGRVAAIADRLERKYGH